MGRRFKASNGVSGTVNKIECGIIFATLDNGQQCEFDIHGNGEELSIIKFF